MDGSKQAVVNLKLEAAKFEKFYCKRNMTAGLNMTSLYIYCKLQKYTRISERIVHKSLNTSYKLQKFYA